MTGLRSSMPTQGYLTQVLTCNLRSPHRHTNPVPNYCRVSFTEPSSISQFVRCFSITVPPSQALYFTNSGYSSALHPPFFTSLSIFTYYNLFGPKPQFVSVVFGHTAQQGKLSGCSAPSSLTPAAFCLLMSSP